MRRSWLSLVLLLLVLAACGGDPAAVVEPSPTPILIPTRPAIPTSSISTGGPATCGLAETMPLGAVVSLSGAASEQGISIRQGMELALEEINEQQIIGPQAELSLIFEDDQSDKDVASLAFRRLVEEERVLGLLGPTLPTAAFQAAPVSQALGIPTMGTSTTVAGITEIGSYIFRDSLPEADVIPNTISLVRKAFEFESVAILYNDSDRFTQAGFEVMQRAAEVQGLHILGVERFATGDNDLTEQLTRLKELNPEALLVSALPEETASLLGQLRAQGITVPVIGGDSFNSPTLLEEAGAAAEGLYVGSAWFIATPLPENIAFVDAYRAKYEAEPDQLAAQAYTGVWLFAHALRNACSMNPRDIRDALGALRLVPTPLGKFSFTRERNPLHPPVVLAVEEGAFALFQGTE